MSRWTQSGMLALTPAQKIAGLMRAGDVANGDRDLGERQARSLWHSTIEAGADVTTLAGEVEEALRTFPHFNDSDGEGNSK